MSDETHSEVCKWCLHPGPHPVIIGPFGQHWGKVNCLFCGRQLRWLPKPQDDPSKYKRPASHAYLVRKYSRGFCELCLRREDELPPRTELTGHHVIEYRAGGEPTRENVWVVCRACERLIHWARTYHGTAESIGDILGVLVPPEEDMP